MSTHNNGLYREISTIISEVLLDMHLSVPHIMIYFQTKTPSLIHHDNHEYMFEGFSIFTHKKISEVSTCHEVIMSAHCPSGL